MKAKFETSLGWVEVSIQIADNISERRQRSIEDPNWYNKYFDIDVVNNGELIDTLYDGGIGGIVDDDFITYDIEGPLDLLKEKIKKGNAWIHIMLSDGYYGSPEYKLHEVTE